MTYYSVNALKNAEIQTLNDQITEYQQNLDQKDTEISILTEKGENFTYHLLRAMSLLDVSRETRSNGNLYFDYAARIWFPIKEYQLVVDNCSDAMEYYTIASERFDLAEDYFTDTKQYTSVPVYHDIIDLYVSLTKSGYNLSILRYNASEKISEIAEKLKIDAENETLLEEFNATLMASDVTYQQGSSAEQGIIDEIEEEYGDFFNPNREIP